MIHFFNVVAVENALQSVVLPLTITIQRFDTTRIVVISPQHAIQNNSDYDLILKTPTFYRIPAKKLSVLCLQEDSSIDSLRIRRDRSDWEFSGEFSFRIDKKLLVKSVNSKTHQILVFEIASLHADFYNVLTITSTIHTSPILISNYCPFPTVIGQIGCSVRHVIPAFSQLEWIREEPCGNQGIHIDMKGVRGVVSTDVRLGETEKVRIPTAVPVKEEYQLQADVYVRSRGKWKARTARLGDHALFLYTSPNLTKLVRRGHSPLSLALPLFGVRVLYHPSRSQQSPSLRNRVLSQAASLKSVLQSTFTMRSLQQQIAAMFPQADMAQMVQDLSVLGMLYKLPQGVSTPMSLQQEPLYAFRTHPIAPNCCVILELASTRIELFFASSGIAEEWAKKVRFEAETAPPVTDSNYLAFRTRHTEIRDVNGTSKLFSFSPLVLIQSSQKGLVPVLSIAPSDIPAVSTQAAFSLFQNIKMTIDVYISGIGLSLIDGTPEEMCYIWLDEWTANVLIQDEVQTVIVNLKNLQIDVSSYNATFPALLYTLPQTIDHRPSSYTLPPSPSSPPHSPSESRSSNISMQSQVDLAGLGASPIQSRSQILHNLSKQEKETAELVQNAEQLEKKSSSVCTACGFAFVGDKRPFLHICCKRHANQQNCFYLDRGLVSFEKIVLKVDEQFIRRLNAKFGRFFVSS